jgi:cytochrome P450
MLLSLVYAVVWLVLMPVILLVGFLGYSQLKNWWRYRSSGCNIPAAKEKFLLGSFDLVDRRVAGEKLYKELGPIYYASMLTLPIISVADPDIAHHVFLKENFPKNILASAKKVLGDSMVLKNHAEPNSTWKRERRLAEPAFKMSNLRALNHIFITHSQAFTQHLLTKYAANSTESFEVTEEFPRLTMDILSTSGFSYPLELLSQNQGRQFLTSVQNILRGLATPLIFMPFGGDIIKWRDRKLNEIVDNTFYKVIDERLAELDLKKDDAAPSAPRDLLDMLLLPDEEGNRLDRLELRNELMLFYIAGHETTATFLGWFFYCMCRYPKVAQKVREEIDNILGVSDGKNLASPNNEQIEQMVYTKMAMNETLRLYPPVISLGREIPETFEMKGYRFPKGVNVSVNIYNLHRNPEIWSNPEEFDPERFSKENASGRHLFAFIPFSAGPRICLGRRFFYNEALVIIGTLFRELTFELDSTKENGMPTRFDPVYKAAHVWVRAHRRFNQKVQTN